jgi:hypothetical protein
MRAEEHGFKPCKEQPFFLFNIIFECLRSFMERKQVFDLIDQVFQRKLVIVMPKSAGRMAGRRQLLVSAQ